MEITIELPPDLEQNLIRQSEQSNVPLQTLVLQALRQGIQFSYSSNSQWSDLILSYEGIPEFPSFESYREELLQPPESNLF